MEIVDLANAAAAGGATPEPGFWPWLWARVVEIQTMIGAIVGLIGLGVVALINHRMELRRDDRRHEREGRDLANLVAAELNDIAINLKNELDTLGRYETISERWRYLHALADGPSSVTRDLNIAPAQLKVLPRPLMKLSFPVFSGLMDLRNALTRARQIEVSAVSEEQFGATGENLLRTARNVLRAIAYVCPYFERYADLGEVPPLEPPALPAAFPHYEPPSGAAPTS